MRKWLVISALTLLGNPAQAGILESLQGVFSSPNYSQYRHSRHTHNRSDIHHARALWHRPYHRHANYIFRAKSVGLHLLSGVYAPLASKARKIVATCGSTVISGFRRNAHVAGTSRLSEHATGHAVDIRGNYGCIYAQLSGWPGGVAVDGPRIGHVHFSLGGHEDGSRFIHHSGHHKHHRRHRHHR